jgi:hypothetical protein
VGLETLGEFRDGLNLALGEKRQGNERLDQWINDGVIELFGELDIQGRRQGATADTIIDQKTYDVPADLLAMLSLRINEVNKRLIKTSIENFELFDDTRTGTPTHYQRAGAFISLYPLPDAIQTMQMFFIKEPPQLVGASDVSGLPSMYDRVIHLISLRNALIDLEENERATFTFQIAENKLRKLPTEEWLESQNPAEGIAIARSFRDLQSDPKMGADEAFRGRVLL